MNIKKAEHMKKTVLQSIKVSHLFDRYLKYVPIQHTEVRTAFFICPEFIVPRTVERIQDKKVKTSLINHVVMGTQHGFFHDWRFNYERKEIDSIKKRCLNTSESKHEFD